MGGIGDGGFIATNNKNIYKKINTIKNQGQKSPYRHINIGYNSRLDSINAMVLNEKLKIFSEIKKSRNEFYEFYLDIFSDQENFTIYKKKSENTLLNYFCITLPEFKRDKFQSELFKRGIETKVYYEKPLHLQPIMNSEKFTLKIQKICQKKFYPYHTFRFQKKRT